MEMPREWHIEIKICFACAIARHTVGQDLGDGSESTTVHIAFEDITLPQSTGLTLEDSSVYEVATCLQLHICDPSHASTSNASLPIRSILHILPDERPSCCRLYIGNMA